MWTLPISPDYSLLLPAEHSRVPLASGFRHILFPLPGSLLPTSPHLVNSFFELKGRRGFPPQMCPLFFWNIVYFKMVYFLKTSLRKKL